MILNIPETMKFLPSKLGIEVLLRKVRCMRLGCSLDFFLYHFISLPARDNKKNYIDFERIFTFQGTSVLSLSDWRGTSVHEAINYSGKT